MKLFKMTLLVGVLGVATGCGATGAPAAPVTGVVTEHEYHPYIPGQPAVAPKQATGCRWTGTGTKRVWTCTTPAQPGRAAVPPQLEWWELEITTADGTEVDITVTREVYDAYEDGDPYPENPKETSQS